jgi:hypothetical protein
MLNLKKIFINSLCALSIVVGSSAITSEKANAGIIVIASTSTAAIVGPVIGLGMTSAGFFWGIQSDDLNYKAAVLFVLDTQIETNKLESILSARYPELDSYLVNELASLMVEESSKVEFDHEGKKLINLREEKLASILEVLENTNPELSQQIRSELTK